MCRVDGEQQTGGVAREGTVEDDRGQRGEQDTHRSQNRRNEPPRPDPVGVGLGGDAVEFFLVEMEWRGNARCGGGGAAGERVEESRVDHVPRVPVETDRIHP